MIRDYNLDQGYNSLTLRAWDFDTLADAALGTGAAVMTHFNSLGVVGALMGDEGDLCTVLWPFPMQIDETKPLEMRIIYFHTAAAADVPIWKVHYKLQTDGAAATVSSPTALTFDGDTCTATANAIEATAWKIVPAGTFTRGGIYIIQVECDSFGGASSDEIYFAALQIAYKPSISKGLTA